MKTRHRPLLSYWDWQSHAVCRTTDGSVFFSPQGERGSARRAREERARAICARCPVRDACARTALRSGGEYGVWGGLSEQERRELRSPRRPARPASAGVPVDPPAAGSAVPARPSQPSAARLRR
ncbi:WhiB family transcriptional regulator [Streptomyces gilvus]|uniref:WhiB family transcriptional regulator n=1 Tax=Streptomyces gilvus TaxID=2920937 RepID=UPI001F100D12|nr:WhiB family transcriptional regulator [Streptomyces sp. CME 23]MCH5676887.1 WhiB family transcriptional regulator [Streptomyces sp. CME 23]